MSPLPPPKPHEVAPSFLRCALGTKLQAPTPDGHEHGKQDCPLVVDHVGDLGKSQEHGDGCRGWGTSGLGEVSRHPDPLKAGRGAAGGRVICRKGMDGGTLLMMETMICLLLLLITGVSGGFLCVVVGLLGWV